MRVPVKTLLVAVCVIGVGLAAWYPEPTIRKLADVRISVPAALISDAELALRTGNYHFGESTRAHNLERAEAYFERALELDPLVRDAWHQLARIEFLRGNFEIALEKIDTQLSLHGDELMAAHYIRGLILGYMGRYREAEPEFKTFIAWDSENWAAWNDLAWVYFSEGDFKASKDAAERGLERNPRNPWLLNSLGVSLLNLGGASSARVVFEQVAALLEGYSARDWMRAYPGNDPRIAEQGLAEFKKTIMHNITLSSEGGSL